MAETSLSMTYRGPAVEAGRMDVRDLAPSLLALGDLFVEMSTIVYPDHPPVSLEISASHEGSFVVDLFLRGRDDLVNLLISDPTTALVNLQQLVIEARLGVLSLIKRIRGRDITEEQSLDDGTVRLLLGDGNAITTSPEALEGYRRLTIRRSSERIGRPLREGVDDIGFVETVSEEATVELVREDLAAFEPPAPDAAEQLSSTREAVVEVRSSVFDGNKWRVHDGESSFYVDIEDRSVLRRVEAGEHFAAGDQLRVDLRTDQVTRLDGTLSTQHAIVAVHEHRHRPEPPPRLDFGEA